MENVFTFELKLTWFSYKLLNQKHLSMNSVKILVHKNQRNKWHSSNIKKIPNYYAFGSVEKKSERSPPLTQLFSFGDVTGGTHLGWVDWTSFKLHAFLCDILFSKSQNASYMGNISNDFWTVQLFSLKWYIPSK